MGWLHAGEARTALANDAVFNVVQAATVVAFVLVGFRSPEAVIVAWGLGAVAGSVFGLRQFRPEGITAEASPSCVRAGT